MKSTYKFRMSWAFESVVSGSLGMLRVSLTADSVVLCEVVSVVHYGTCWGRACCAGLVSVWKFWAVVVGSLCIRGGSVTSCVLGFVAVFAVLEGVGVSGICELCGADGCGRGRNLLCVLTRWLWYFAVITFV